MTSKRPRRPLNPEPAPLGGLSLAALAENNRDLTTELVKRRAAAVILAETNRDLKRRLITARERPAVAHAGTQTAPPSPPSACTATTRSPSPPSSRASSPVDDAPFPRRARRPRAIPISYAEPSLKAKMRRP